MLLYCIYISLTEDEQNTKKFDNKNPYAHVVEMIVGHI